jgi:hypothetical protein
VGFRCGGTDHGNDFVGFKLKDTIFALQMATKAIAVSTGMSDEDSLNFLENMTRNIRQNWKS